MYTDWVIWDISDVYAMAASVRDLLVSSFNKVLPLFLVILVVVSIIRLLHDYFGKNGTF